MSADLRAIHSDADHETALAEAERLWGAPLGSPERDRLEVLAILIDEYEKKRWPFDAPDPIAAIEFHMERLGLTRKDLEPMIGSRARVAEVMNRKRGLSIEMIRRLHEGLGIPAEVLIKPSKREQAA